jgi:hypothetical protein
MTATLAVRPRFRTRRRVAVWALIAALLMAGILLLRERARDAYTAATIERVNRLGGFVRQYREEIGWQQPLRGIPLIQSFLGRNAIAVDLKKTAPTLDDMREVVSLQNLRELDLTDATGIDDRALEVVSEATRLGVLALSGTSANNEGVLRLAGRLQLWTLMLDDTKVTDEGVAALRPSFGKVISVRGANVTAVAGEGVTVSGLVRAGGLLTVTGRVFVRELPPGGRVVLTAMLLPPGERTSADVSRLALTAAPGWQDFSLAGKSWGQTGPFTLEVNAFVGGSPFVIYRVARVPIDVLPAEAAPPAKDD